ncbi:MAG: SLBB domain-containing protein [candidate division WOR-3 bacterium]|nr:SLBB domain-containing protein [candidate division WOR-3 bacterium]
MKRIIFLGILTLSIFKFLIAQPQKEETIIKAHIWGEVRNPGSYNLSYTGDILELISKAGGPTSNADLSKVNLFVSKEKRKITVNLNKAIKKGEMLLLDNGDVVIIPRSKFAIIKETLPFITTLAVFLNLYLTYITRR